LNHALETQRRLGIDLVIAGDGRSVFADKSGQILAQLFDIGATGAQGFRCRRIVEQGKQEMLHGNELMTFLPRFDKCHMQADFEFLRNHSVFLHYARQGMLVAACEGCDLLNFCGRDIARVDSTDSPPFGVDFEHDPRRLFSIQAKKLLQNDDHEIHRCEVVVQQQDLVQWWRRELRASCFEQ
jgi:hypothetical protein